MLHLYFLIQNKVNPKVKCLFSPLFQVWSTNNCTSDFSLITYFFPVMYIFSQKLNCREGPSKSGWLGPWSESCHLWNDTGRLACDTEVDQLPCSVTFPVPRHDSVSLNMPLKGETLEGLIWLKIEEEIILGEITG